jgi:flagellar hook-associated protein 2
VSAAVSTTIENGVTRSTLTLSAEQTGESSAFSVRDLSGNLAATMGINSVTTEAQNAVFSVNGDARTSESNEISLAAGVTATLQGEGESSISFGRSTAQSVTAARELVNAINAAIRGTNPNDGRGSERFLNDLIGMNINFESSLQRIGINVGQNGQLSINEGRLTAAAEDGSLGRFFEGGGFTARAERVAFNATGTTHYANRPPAVNLGGTNNFDFSNSQNQWAMLNMFG